MSRRSAADRRAEADRMFRSAHGAAPAWATPTLRVILGYRRAGLGAWPSQAFIAKRIGRSPRTVKRHVAALVAAEVLEVESHRPHHDAVTGRWRRRTNRYRCRFPRKTPRKTPGQATRRAAPTPRGHARHHDVPTVIPSTSADPADAVVGPVGGLIDAPDRPTRPPAWLIEQTNRLRHRRGPG